MSDTKDYDAWVQRYIGAWNSNHPDEIADLFTPDAVYLPTPYTPGWRGGDEIVRQWLDRKDEPGDTRFQYEIIAATDEIGIVRGHTLYLADEEEYFNLWEVTLEGERCSRFVEWWVQPPKNG
jgi:uncharacterized protein (TIGR02246 family)